MKITSLVALACVASALAVNAQGLHGMMGKARALAKPVSGASSYDTGPALAHGNDLLTYVTTATDQGVKAVQELTDLYPAEKVQAIREAAAKYNELRAQNPNQNLDSESMQLASSVANEASKLANDWQGYHKEKLQAVRRADSRLSLVLLADAQAALKAPAAMTDLQNASQALASDPMQAANSRRLLSLATALTAVGKNSSQQIGSFTTVRGVARKIAEAEKIQLVSDPSPASVRDSSSLTTSVQELDK